MASRKIVFYFLFSIFYFLVAPSARAETPQDVQSLIEIRQKQIAEIEEQISGYWDQVDAKKAQGASVSGDIEALKSKIAQSELEIRSLKLAIEESGYKLKQTEGEIGKVSGNLDETRARLAVSLRVLRSREEAPFLIRFAAAETVSDMFIVLNELEQLHASLRAVLSRLKSTKAELEETRDAIAQEREAQERLRRIEESQKEIVAQRRARQTQILAQIEKEQSKIIGTIVSKKRDLDKIRAQITYLGKVGVSAEEAVRFGELAAIRTGVRTAFLIAVLEVESRLGLNVGSGYWEKDMHPRDHDAFFAITSKLGLDPNTTKVSRKPSYGWGGAMGPAQFLPNTWLAHEAEVARLTGHNPPNPWNIEDAFTAAAVKLSRQGAAKQTRAGEVAAARAYIGGSPNCARSICNSYANLVLEKAEEIEVELQKNGSS
ncbi:hypothetical protein HY477_03035 [Candidatus Uhrbacteria bacterium]|nr:hypothetical protein [Candidatus Uhrbacteria bacterium]